MSQQIIAFLKDDFTKRKEKNKRFSLRAYAKHIGIEHSTLSKIFSGKRPVTFELANKVFNNLKVQAPIKNSLILTLVDDKNYSPLLKDEEYISLSDDEFRQIYQWHFAALICYFDLPQTEKTIAAAAKYFNLSEAVVQNACNVLLKLGFFKAEDGKFIPTGHNFLNQISPQSTALQTETNKKSHEDHLDLAKEALNLDIPQSHFRGVTMTMPLHKYEEAERRIKEFIRSFSNWLNEEEGDIDSIYRVSIQFFPLEQIKKKQTEK